jgi:hypothetical protein
MVIKNIIPVSGEKYIPIKVKKKMTIKGEKKLNTSKILVGCLIFRL